MENPVRKRLAWLFRRQTELGLDDLARTPRLDVQAELERLCREIEGGPIPPKSRTRTSDRPRPAA